jgi:hypothetical protein
MRAAIDRPSRRGEWFGLLQERLERALDERQPAAGAHRRHEHERVVGLVVEVEIRDRVLVATWPCGTSNSG